MKVLNLSSINLGKFSYVYEPSHLPDIIVSDESTPKDYLEYVSQNFITAHVGEIDIPTVDYKFADKNELLDFLKRYSEKGVRERLKEFYNRTYDVNDYETVSYVIYYGYSAYMYERLKKLLLNPLKPWVVVYGPTGSGKLSLIKSIVGNKYLDIFNISERYKMGFKVENVDEQIDDVIINTSLLRGDREIKEIMDFLYSRGYQAIFIVESREIPNILSTIPSFYVPSLVERPVKERLLILEHLIRIVSKSLNVEVQISEDFIITYFTYGWPNNFSELENAIRFALTINPENLSTENLPDHIKNFSSVE